MRENSHLFGPKSIRDLSCYKLQMKSAINTFGISTRQFKKLLTLKNLSPVRYRISGYGNKNKIPLHSPLPDDNDAFMARKVLVVDQLYITGINPSGKSVEIFYSLFSKQNLQNLQEQLNLLK